MEKILNEYQLALRSAELDAFQRPVKFTLFGKVHKAFFSGDVLTGFEVDGMHRSLSTDGTNTAAKTLFVRDGNGGLTAALPFNQHKGAFVGLRLPREAVYTPESAKLELNREQLNNVRTGASGKQDSVEQFLQYPCFVCDFNANADVGYCGFVAGGFWVWVWVS
jgi:hypothetical protein